jgi:RNA polymerase sporulation-specific sigma factor
LALGILFNILGECYFLVGYIVNGNVFQHPLTEGEERDLFEKFHLGDETAKTELISRNLRLIVHILKKFSLQENLDDLISIGTVGLIKAVENFDYTKGSRLSSYAARCIENEVLMYLRSVRKNKTEVYLEDPIGIDSDAIK